MLGQPICETDPEKSAFLHKMLRQTREFAFDGALRYLDLA